MIQRELGLSDFEVQARQRGSRGRGPPERNDYARMYYARMYGGPLGLLDGLDVDSSYSSG